MVILTSRQDATNKFSNFKFKYIKSHYVKNMTILIIPDNLAVVNANGYNTDIIEP
jgi:hypothetical protein